MIAVCAACRKDTDWVGVAGDMLVCAGCWEKIKGSEAPSMTVESRGEDDTPE
jgi:hypothetical protein